MNVRSAGRVAIGLAAVSALTWPTPAASADAGPETQLVLGAGQIAIGRGLRFNNPYRLETPVGERLGGVAWTALNLDAAGAFAVRGGPFGSLHGARLAVAFPLTGVAQLMATPAYFVGQRVRPELFLAGWLGAPLVLAPDTNVGAELGASVQYRVYSGWNLVADAVFDMFWGAATHESQATVYPVLGAQIGVSYRFEVAL